MQIFIINGLPSVISYLSVLMYADYVKNFLSYSDYNFQRFLQKDLLTLENNNSNNYTRCAQKASRILNFRGLCWYSCFLFMPTSTAILNVQLIFDRCFADTCLIATQYLAQISGKA